MVACEAPNPLDDLSDGSDPIGLLSAYHDTRLYREFIDSWLVFGTVSVLRWGFLGSDEYLRSLDATVCYSSFHSSHQFSLQLHLSLSSFLKHLSFRRSLQTIGRSLLLVQLKLAFTQKYLATTASIPTTDTHLYINGVLYCPHRAAADPTSGFFPAINSALPPQGPLSRPKSILSSSSNCSGSLSSDSSLYRSKPSLPIISEAPREEPTKPNPKNLIPAPNFYTMAKQNFGALGAAFTVVRGMQIISLVTIIGMTANFIQEMVNAKQAPPKVLVGTLSVVSPLIASTQALLTPSRHVLLCCTV